MPLLRDVILPGLAVIAAFAAAGCVIRRIGGDEPREDRAVRALQERFGHHPDVAGAALTAESDVTAAAREPIDRVTAPLSWYSGVPQTIGNGAIWCGVTWLLTRRARSAIAPGAALAVETACFVSSAALVGRLRPQRVWRPETPHGTASFPSGHTAAAFALHGTLADLLDRHRGGAGTLGPVLRYGIPSAIAFSRIYRGQHHISDVVAGALLGRWSAVLVHRELVAP
ncbi:phosphatase PAP2 family protein [Microbacterium sp. SSW1-59]|uniref:phosphatase PAP2 family protein n=1 Tax=Microbacterium xanthum TaxID=3079794 RepID=UPI002AD37B0C|nr:phosphatase PAP2 family protein [Microbacterium sp. SSW1-59]MDZ8200762.1 phosphatase PAP2 family protein [Microbacterium sp. SSW1-59]